MVQSHKFCGRHIWMAPNSSGLDNFMFAVSWVWRVEVAKRRRRIEHDERNYRKKMNDCQLRRVRERQIIRLNQVLASVLANNMLEAHVSFCGPVTAKRLPI